MTDLNHVTIVIEPLTLQYREDDFPPPHNIS